MAIFPVGVLGRESELDVSRDLKARKGMFAVRDELFSVQAGSRAADHKDLHFLLGQITGHPDRCGLNDVLVQRDSLFDLECRDVLATPANGLLSATDEEHVAVAVDATEVAGVEGHLDRCLGVP